VRAAPAGSLLGRLADWFFDCVSAERMREVEDYLSRASNERELSQRLHRVGARSALLAT
jgi:membrane protein YqaA with SNARE-associated domain